MVPLTIKRPEAVKQLLEREARQSGKSVSALIREAVSVRLRKSTAGGSLYDRARDLCGAGSSGRPDLATNREVFREFGERNVSSSIPGRWLPTSATTRSFTRGPAIGFGNWPIR